MDNMTMNKKIKKRDATNTTRFLLPAFGVNYKKYEELGFINCYLADKDREKVSEDIHIYFLFKPQDVVQSAALNKMIENLEESTQNMDNPLLLEDYDYEGGYVVMVLKLNDIYRNDYELFLKGKYSHFSDTFKDIYPEERIIDFHPDDAHPGKYLRWMAIHKDPRLLKWQENKIGVSLQGAEEYWTIPNQEVTELLDIERIRMEEEKVTKLKD